MAGKVYSRSVAKISSIFLAGKWQIKKRHPRKDVSVSGIEQGGTVEKPWPPVAS